VTDAVQIMRSRCAIDPEHAAKLLRRRRYLWVDVGHYEAALQSIVDDGGNSYCYCGGLSYGFMIGCDTCDSWYHAQCLGFDEASWEAANGTATREGASAGEMARVLRERLSSAITEVTARLEKEEEERNQKRSRAGRVSRSTLADAEPVLVDVEEMSEAAKERVQAVLDALDVDGMVQSAAAAGAAKVFDGLPGTHREGGLPFEEGWKPGSFRCPGCCTSAGVPYAYEARLRVARAANDRGSLVESMPRLTAPPAGTLNLPAHAGRWTPAKTVEEAAYRLRLDAASGDVHAVQAVKMVLVDMLRDKRLKVAHISPDGTTLIAGMRVHVQTAITNQVRPRRKRRDSAATLRASRVVGRTTPTTTVAKPAVPAPTATQTPAPAPAPTATPAPAPAPAPDADVAMTGAPAPAQQAEAPGAPDTAMDGAGEGGVATATVVLPPQDVNMTL
jgi:hypothetical protein